MEVCIGRIMMLGLGLGHNFGGSSCCNIHKSLDNSVAQSRNNIDVNKVCVITRLCSFTSHLLPQAHDY